MSERFEEHVFLVLQSTGPLEYKHKIGYKKVVGQALD